MRFMSAMRSTADKEFGALVVVRAAHLETQHTRRKEKRCCCASAKKQFPHPSESFETEASRPKIVHISFTETSSRAEAQLSLAARV